MHLTFILTIIVSENDNCHKSCGESRGKERLERKALRQPEKTDIDSADVTCWGRCYIVCCTVVYISPRNTAVAEIADRTALEILGYEESEG